jgi:hypothetical protein
VRLDDLIQQLERLDPDATIYAGKPWNSGTRAVVAVEPEDGSIPPDAAGLDYFLEVYLALEAATASDAGTRFERVLYYAENDAFLRDD